MNAPTNLLTIREAARRLTISERTLWGLTAPRGPIVPARIGRSVRYADAVLDEYIRRVSKTPDAA